MKQVYLTFLLAFFVTATAFAQKDFRPGYIVKDADTLQGYVDYRGAVRSAKLTTFKANLGAPEQEFDPTQLAGYGFVKENKVYESQAIPGQEAQPTQRLFVQVLVRGKASLYVYRDVLNVDHYYLSKDGGKLVELKENVYNKKDDKTGKTFRMVDQLYLGTLRSALYDCPEMTEARLSKTELRLSSLTKVANDYNDCMGGKQYVQPSKKTTVKPSLVLSYYKPALKVSGEHPYGKTSFENTSLGLGGGIALEFANPSISEKLSLLLEVLYAPHRFEGEINQVNLGRTTNYDILFDLHYLKVPAQLRYTFPKGKVRPFINAGASYSYAFSTNRVETKNSTFQNTSYTEVTEALPGTAYKQYVFGLQGGIGLLYPMGEKWLHIETRYETNEGISNVKTLASSFSGISILAGYRF